MIKDSFNRLHTYLRISLTDSCNLRCFYCIPEQEYVFTPSAKLMSAAEIEILSKLFVVEGVTKIRLTGGEPLVRTDAKDIILALSKLPVLLTLTTNGVSVDRFIDVFEKAGVNSVNVSLDTLQADKFHRITRRNQFERVFKNIHLLSGQGFEVKVNVVVVKGVNDKELTDFVEWTSHSPLHIRFIEFMPFSGNGWESGKLVPMEQILERVGEKYAFAPLEHKEHQTAKAYRAADYAGTFSVISTMSAHFCSDCNRMGLTADGKLKNCLFSKQETDLLTALRSGTDVIGLIHDSIQAKARQLRGQLDTDFTKVQADSIENRSMITIGG